MQEIDVLLFNQGRSKDGYSVPSGSIAIPLVRSGGDLRR